MKIIRGVGGVLSNPFILFVIMFIVLYELGQVYAIIPGPYAVNGAGLSDVMTLIGDGDMSTVEAVVIAAGNRIAAFEVSYVALLLCTVLISIYLLFAHRSDNIHWKAARVGVPVLILVGAWDVINRVTCKAASNEIVSKSIDWTNESAQGLCARSIGAGVIKAEIAVGFICMGYVAWLYYRTWKDSK